MRKNLLQIYYMWPLKSHEASQLRAHALNRVDISLSKENPSTLPSSSSIQTSVTLSNQQQATVTTSCHGMLLFGSVNGRIVFAVYIKYENAAAPHLVITAVGQIADDCCSLLAAGKRLRRPAGLITVCVVLSDSLRSVPFPLAGLRR